MNKEQYEKVKRFKPEFEMAKTNFCRVSRGNLEIIRNVYNEAFNKSLLPSNMNCNACVIKMMKAMGEAVEKYEKWYEARHGNKDNEPASNSNETPQE